MACFEHLGIDRRRGDDAGATEQPAPDEAERESDEKHDDEFHDVSLATGTDTIVETGR